MKTVILLIFSFAFVDRDIDYVVVDWDKQKSHQICVYACTGVSFSGMIDFN